jgi:hypothetical protein
MLSQNLRVKGPPPTPEEHPYGKVFAERLCAQLRVQGVTVVGVDDWRDCGWLLVCRVADVPLEVVLAWDEGLRDWYFQIYATDPRSDTDGEKCTAIARTLVDALSWLGAFSDFRHFRQPSGRMTAFRAARGASVTYSVESSPYGSDWNIMSGWREPSAASRR